jgi:hypothetical protein
VDALANEEVRVKRIITISIILATTTLVGMGAERARSTRVPPNGIPIASADRSELQSGAEALGQEIRSLQRELADKPDLINLLPDVQIFHKAVNWALRYDEFYRSNEVGLARLLLKQGRERAGQLRDARTPWLSATGLVVRGYLSRIDRSIQPYGLVVPPGFAGTHDQPRRLDVWLHGRDNHLTELKFIAERQKSYGEFTPTDTIVLHPYGRYCNAFKFAGETDVFEAMEHVKRFYRIDDRRIALRGFSMGGAGVWHLAAHHPGVWAVAAPGAGFAETAEYQKLGTNRFKVPWWEQRLWQRYDATDYAANFFNLPVIAYNGTDDSQRQAADVMERALKKEGLTLLRVWGTNVGHKYTPEAKNELNQFVDDVVARGKTNYPSKVHLTTRSAAYNWNGGVRIRRLEREWERADVVLEVLRDRWTISVTNVSTFEIERPAGEFASWISLNGQSLSRKGRGQRVVFQKRANAKWRINFTDPFELAKEFGQQGPIDDAFTDRFLFVRPTGQPQNAAAAAWLATKMARATNDWRAQFRGEVQVKDDTEVTDADLAQNLILWGDPQSNRLLARIAKRLPIQWNAKSVQVGRRSFSATNHVPAYIFPNPLSRAHYVVVNSGFTFAAAGLGSNAQQTPKLPDYAVFDFQRDGAVVLADFFDEEWRVR